MFQKVVIFIFVLLVLNPSTTTGQTQKERSLYSAILKDSVTYLYAGLGATEKADSVNLLVLLDGDEYFGIATDVVRLFELDGKLHPTVVIGLPSTVESRWKHYTPTKSKPYENSDPETIELFNASGEFDQYADFIQLELLPEIEKGINQKLHSKTVFGHSMGGLGALSFLIEGKKLFDNYIAASPSLIWDNHYVLEKLDTELNQKSNSYQFEKLYLTIAEDDIPNYEEGVNYFIEYMEQLKKNPQSTIVYKKYTAETHMTVGLRSLFEGILQVLVK